MVSSRVLSRASSLLAVGGIAGAAVLGFAPSASADGASNLRYGGHVADTDGRVYIEGQQLPSITELMLLSETNDKSQSVAVYCIDLHTLLQASANYHEGAWKDSWLNPKAVPFINWILNNSYPHLKLEDVAGKAGIKPSASHPFTAQEAVEATQAAIWHYSNGANLDSKREHDGNVVKLYDYLTGKANVGLSTEPTASLEFQPGSVTGNDGDTPGVGPLKLVTNANTPASVSIDGKAPKGVSLVDKDGKPTSSASNGQDVYVKVPKGTAPGSVKLSAEVKAPVNVGRVFLGDGDDRNKTQTLIAAGSAPVSVKAAGEASWTKAKPTPSPSASPSTTPSSSPSPSESPSPSASPSTTPSESPSASPSETPSETPSASPSESAPVVVPTPTPTDTTPASPIVTGGPDTPVSVPFVPAASTTSSQLAETGGNSSSTGLIAGSAAALLVAGGGAIYFARRRRANGTTA